MDARLLVGGGLVALLTYVARRVWAWLLDLDAKSIQHPAENHFEDPSSLIKVPAPSIFGEPTKTLSVVVPAYNEEERLAPMLEEMLAYLQKRRDRQGAHFTYEVIVVNDGSSDGTSAVAFDFIRRFGFDAVRLLQLPQNCGKGYAVKAGMLCARGELLLMADADGATVAAEEQRLEEALQKVKISPAAAWNHGIVVVPVSAPVPAQLQLSQAVGVAVGSRAHLQQQAMAKRSWHRNILTRGFHLLVMLVIGGAVKDTQCGFKLFTRKSAALLFCNMRLQRWCFDVELIYLAQRLRIPVTEVSVNWTEIPGSKIKVTSMLHMAWELLVVMAAYKVIGVWAVRTTVEEFKTAR